MQYRFLARLCAVALFSFTLEANPCFDRLENGYKKARCPFSSALAAFFWIGDVYSTPKVWLGNLKNASKIENNVQELNENISQEIERMDKLTGWQRFRERTFMLPFIAGTTGVIACFALWYTRGRITPPSLLRPFTSHLFTIPGAALSSLVTIFSYDSRYGTLTYTHTKANEWLKRKNPFLNTDFGDSEKSAEENSDTIAEVETGNMYPAATDTTSETDYTSVDS